MGLAGMQPNSRVPTCPAVCWHCWALQLPSFNHVEQLGCVHLYERAPLSTEQALQPVSGLPAPACHEQGTGQHSTPVCWHHWLTA